MIFKLLKKYWSEKYLRVAIPSVIILLIAYVFFSRFVFFNSILLIILLIINIIYFFLIVYFKVANEEYLGLGKFTFYIFCLVWGIILLFASIYSFGANYGYGVIDYANGDYTINTWESIYFSAVTFFSLGYGDFSPKGISRFFSIIEVSLCQVLLVIFVAWAISHSDKIFKKKNKKAEIILKGGENE